MLTMTIDIDLSLLGKEYGPIDLRGMDDLHYRFVRGNGSGALTGVLTLREALTVDDHPVSGGTALVMDGTINTLDITTFAYGWPVVTTAQAGNDGRLHIYARRNIIDGGGA